MGQYRDAVKYNLVSTLTPKNLKVIVHENVFYEPYTVLPWLPSRVLHTSQETSILVFFRETRVQIT